MTEILPENPSSSLSDSDSGVRNVIENLQNVFGFVLAFTAFLSGSGFVVVHSFLAQYTRLYNYHITPEQFLSAGVGMLVFTLASLILVMLLLRLLIMVDTGYSEKLPFSIKHADEPAPMMALIVILFIILLILMIPAWLDKDNETLDTLVGMTLMLIVLVAGLWLMHRTGQELNQQTPNFPQAAWLDNLFIIAPIVVLVIVYVVYTGSLYGRQIYGAIPREFGGGYPATVLIVMHSNRTAERLGLTFDEDGKSEPVCLLAQLTQGLLTYNPHNQRSIIIPIEENTLAGYSNSDTATDCSPPLPDNDD